MTAANQSVSGTITFEGFGQTVATTGSSSNPYMFKGAWGYRNDGDAGLHHVGARYYDAQAGRFITRDTYLDQHPYLYCEHNPVSSADPSGHKSVGLTLGGMAVCGIGMEGSISITIDDNGIIGLGGGIHFVYGPAIGATAGPGITGGLTNNSTGVTPIDSIIGAFGGWGFGAGGAVGGPGPGDGGIGQITNISGTVKYGPTFGGGVYGGTGTTGNIAVDIIGGIRRRIQWIAERWGF